jgi:hypothetical protein
MAASMMPCLLSAQASLRGSSLALPVRSPNRSRSRALAVLVKAVTPGGQTRTKSETSSFAATPKLTTSTGRFGARTANERRENWGQINYPNPQCVPVTSTNKHWTCPQSLSKRVPSGSTPNRSIVAWHEVPGRASLKPSTLYHGVCPQRDKEAQRG